MHTRRVCTCACHGTIDGLVCKYCDRKTYLIGTKCCMLPYIPENTIGADKLFLGQGHCTYDWECYGSLICGTSGKKDCTDKSVSNETSCCKEGKYVLNFKTLYTCLTELPRYITQYYISKYHLEKKILQCMHHYDNEAKECPGIGYTCWISNYGKLWIRSIDFCHKLGSFSVLYALSHLYLMST